MNQSFFKYYLILQVAVLFISCKQKVPDFFIYSENEISWKDKLPCIICYREKNDSICFQSKIKNRGGVSSRYYKHSFTFKLPESYPLCNLPADNDWILNAGYIDKTFMRHKICYDLFREMDPVNMAPRCAYANVTVNNDFHGLYVLMERMDATRLGLDKKDSMAMIFKDPPFFYKEKLKYVQDSMNYYHQKYPAKDVSDKTYYIEDFIHFLFYSTDSLFIRDVNKWIDIQNVMDWHILLLFTNNGDGIMKNYYLYKKDSLTPFRLALWDYDHAFGRDGDNELNMMERELDCNRSVLIKRLTDLNYNNYKEELRKRWFELKDKNIISYENMEKHISNNHRIIKNEVDRNFERWPANEKWYYDDNTYYQELDTIRKFTDMRIMYLDQYFLDY